MVALLALLLQVIAIKAPLGGNDDARIVLMVISYVLLLEFVLFNIARPGIAVIGIGLMLNFLAIAANEGMMPITPETMLRTGAVPEDAVVGEWLPGSKDVLMERNDVRIYFLTDRLVWDPISGLVRAFSVGDVIIVAGVAITMVELFTPRFRRLPEGSANGAAA